MWGSVGFSRVREGPAGCRGGVAREVQWVRGVQNGLEQFCTVWNGLCVCVGGGLRMREGQ